MTVIEHPRAQIEVAELDGESRSVTVRRTTSKFMPVGSCTTSYQLPLIEQILDVKGPEYLCDEILRDESSEYVEFGLAHTVFPFVSAKAFEGCSVLDFGCGSGGSTMNLTRLLPETTTFVGIELVPEFVEIARSRAVHHRVDNRVSFMLSPEEAALPPRLEEFDFIVLNAVFEHLLPVERARLVPELWNHLRPGGVLFINETPHRWFPIEGHTTGLPLINYLPDSLAGIAARRLSVRSLGDSDWPTLLRQGIRGGSVTELCRLLDEPASIVMEPTSEQYDDRIDLWLKTSAGARFAALKMGLKYCLKAVKGVTGHQLVPSLTLALRKPEH